MKKLTALVESLRSAVSLHTSHFGGVDAADQLAQMIWLASNGKNVPEISALLKNLKNESWNSYATAVPVAGLSEWPREFRFALTKAVGFDSSLVGIRAEVSGLYSNLLEIVDESKRRK